MQCKDDENYDVDLPYAALVAMEKQQAAILEECRASAQLAKREGDVHYQADYKWQVLLFDPTFPVDTM